MAVILDNLELDEDLKKLKQVRSLCNCMETKQILIRTVIICEDEQVINMKVPNKIK